MNYTLKERGTPKFILGILFFCIFFGVGVNDVNATTTVKVLSDSRHAYNEIVTTVNKLLGTGHVGTDIIIHSTNMTESFSVDTGNALNTTIQRYDQNGVLVPSAGPYQIFTTSATGYSGDTINEYNLSATNDITHNYAFTQAVYNAPPAFHIAPGGSSYISRAGVEWTIDPAIFCTGSLSCLTAANAGIAAVLRFNHPTWNWFDVKAALRQTGANWTTGYNNTTYGFGRINYATANALTDTQILLQPPVTSVDTSTGRISFTIYPFKQTRRVKEVLFQFPSAPAFQGNELTLSGIEALGGTKITEYTGITATTTKPFFTAITNAYFVWFTADNSTDSAANFSRIDTYSVLGPVSQVETAFTYSFNIATPASNTVSSSTSPTFTWGAAESYFGISKYQLYIDGVLNKDDILGTSTTPTSNLSEGTHTWYVKAINTHGAATTTVSTPTINVNTGYAPGYTFYVDNVLGNNNNPGTQALPWATLAKAAVTAGEGDTVIIIKNADQPYREELIPARAGTITSPITFRGVDANNKPEIWGSTDITNGWSVYSGGNPNTYKRTFAVGIGTSLVVAGSATSTLSKRTFSNNDMTALNPGEWFWDSDILYYRLASGETINSLHIEAGSIDYPVYSSGNYITYQDIIVRYANATGVYIQNTGQTARGIEVYDSVQGITIEGTGNLLQYSITARNRSDGITVNYPQNIRIYNSLSYGNDANGMSFYVSTGHTLTLKGNISAGNTGYPFTFSSFSGTPILTTSNSLWDTANDSTWGSYKGTNNQELLDPLFINPAAKNFTLNPLSSAIDTGTTTTGVATDILGNPIYGTPDIGPYEYQPPHTIGTHGINISGSVRLYKDGKYRYTNATTTGSTTATMNITPLGGFPQGDYSEFINITISKWNTTGDHSKTWTETSSSATTTVHTINDLKANTHYSVLVDGTSYTSMLANADGQATFTYAGGYSTHTFEVIEDTAGPTAPSIVSGGTMSSGGSHTFTWDAASDISGLAKYQLYVDGILKEDNITPTSTQTSATGFSCASHTWYVRAIDNAGNSTDSSTQTFTVSCGGGGIMPAGTVLFNTPKPRLQTITNGKVTYLDEKTSTTTTIIPFTAPPPIQSSLTSGIARPSFTRTLKRGVKEYEVVLLQELLKKDPSIYPEGLVTGYFGPLTEGAIKRLQKKYDIVSSGTPVTTGYGMVGPRTRKVLNSL